MLLSTKPYPVCFLESSSTPPRKVGRPRAASPFGRGRARVGRAGAGGSWTSRRRPPSPASSSGRTAGAGATRRLPTASTTASSGAASAAAATGVREVGGGSDAGATGAAGPVTLLPSPRGGREGRRCTSCCTRTYATSTRSPGRRTTGRARRGRPRLCALTACHRAGGGPAGR